MKRFGDPWLWVLLAVVGCSGETDSLSFDTLNEALLTTTASATGSTGSTPTGYLGTLAAVGFLPAHGSTLYGSEPWYDASVGVDGAITIEGGANYLPPSAVTSGNLQVRINGVYGASILWSNIGPNGGAIGFEGTLPASVDPTWVHRDISVTVFDNVTGRVFARATNVIYDLRRENVASPNAEPGAFEGMSAHLMPAGIGDDPLEDHPTSLETPHLSSLPLDGITAFNDALVNAIQNETLEGPPVTACFNLDEVDDAFKTLPQYFSVLAEATALYAVYEAWQNGGEKACLAAAQAASAAVPVLGLLATAGCSVVMQDWCVKDLPAANDFEVCFGRIDGAPRALSVGSVDDVQLSFGAGTTGASIAAQIALGGIEGRLDGLLRGATVHWVEEKCEGRPSADVPDSAWNDHEDASEAATCHDLTLSAAIATTSEDTGANFSVRKRQQNGERVSVTQTADAQFTLVEPEQSARVDLCADAALWSGTDTLLASFHLLVEDTVSDTWNEGQQQARALELMLQRFELGRTNHPRYDLSATLSRLTSQADGADLAWNTLVTPKVPLVDLTPGMYYHPAGDAPFGPDGMDPEDIDLDFDMSFTLNTGFLNQIISTQAKTNLLYFEFAPTWNEVGERFGATPDNTGLPGDADPPLNGAVLSFLHPAFAELGGRIVELHVQPTLDPLAWMNPDPPLTDYADLAFGVNALDVTLVEPATGLVWLSARYSVREPTFDLDITRGSNVLGIPTELSISYFTILSTRFTGCPMEPPGTTGTCEEELGEAMNALLTSLVEPRLLSMLTRIPVPNVWDVQGRAAIPVELVELRQLQMNQNITFVVDIEDR